MFQLYSHWDKDGRRVQTVTTCHQRRGCTRLAVSQIRYDEEDDVTDSIGQKNHGPCLYLTVSFCAQRSFDAL